MHSAHNTVHRNGVSEAALSEEEAEPHREEWRRKEDMTVRSLTVPMKAEGLTSFKIQYDYRTDQFKTVFMKEWEPDLDWSRYNKDFYESSLLADEAKYYNTVQTRELFAKYGLEDYLDQVEDLIRQGKHFGIEGYYLSLIHI